MITVVNMRLHPKTKNDLYIGRPSPLANRWSHRHSAFKNVEIVENAHVAVARYRQWLWESIIAKNVDVLLELSKIGPDSNLVCWCVPYGPCHGEVIKQLFDYSTITIPCEESGRPEYDLSPDCAMCRGTGAIDDDMSDHIGLFKRW